MKKFLLSLTLFTALLGVSNLSLAQCASGGPCNLALSGLTLSITSVEDANGNCTSLKGTITFFIDDNNGNKAIYINLWDQVNYAAGAGEFNWCTKNAKGPTLSQMNGTQNNSGPIGVIGIRNEAPFSFLQTYSPDPTNINIANKKLLQGTTIQVEPAPTPQFPNRKKFILNDVIIPISGCEFSIQGNIWGTNAGSASPSLQCYDDNFSFSVGSVTINEASTFNCAKVPREFQLFLDATGTVPVSYQVYIDDNGNGIVDAAEEVVYTSETFTVSDVNESAPDYSSGFVKIKEPYASQTDVFRKDLLVRVSYFNALTNSTIVLPAYELNNGCATLPVSYASFTATRANNNQIVLEWETAMEENNKGFHVQRNVDGTWKNIGFVFSQANGGNSSEVLKYAFKDANNSKGISQYRILQVDIDGKGKYSQIRSVHGLETAARVVLFPNPSNTGSFSLLFEDATSVRDVVVSDVSGRVVKQFKAVSGSTLTVDGLMDGFYTVQVANRTSGTASVEKVIIKKR